MAKNSAISHKVLREKGRDLVDDKKAADVIFDFIVKDISDKWCVLNS